MPSLFDQQFWQDVEATLWEELDETVLDTLLAGVENGTLLLPANARMLVNFDYVNDTVIDFAQRYRYEWIHGITETTRQQVQKLVSGWVSSGEPLSVLETQLAPVFGEKRAEQIASTEITRITMAGNAEAWESTGVVNTWRWNTVNDGDVCSVCDPLNGEIFDIADQDAYMPAHVNCRCFATPLVDEKAFESILEEILA